VEQRVGSIQHEWHDIDSGSAATSFWKRQQERTEDEAAQKTTDMGSPGNRGRGKESGFSNSVYRDSTDHMKDHPATQEEDD